MPSNGLAQNCSAATILIKPGIFATEERPRQIMSGKLLALYLSINTNNWLTLLTQIPLVLYYALYVTPVLFRWKRIFYTRTEEEEREEEEEEEEEEKGGSSKVVVQCYQE